MVQCFHAFCGVSQTQKCVIQSDQSQAGNERWCSVQERWRSTCFQSTAVIGRTGLRRKMRGYLLIGASQINYPPQRGGTFVVSGLFWLIRYIKILYCFT